MDTGEYIQLAMIFHLEREQTSIRPDNVEQHTRNKTVGVP